MYYARISVKPSGAAATVPWIMRYAGTRAARVTRIVGSAVFSGATSANGLLGFEFARTVMPSELADGAAAAIVTGKLNSGHAAAGLAGLFLAAGVTFTGTTDSAGPLTVYVPQVQGAVVNFDFPGMDSPQFSGGPSGGRALLLLPGQGLVLRLIENSATGLGIAGSVEWTEV